LTSTPYRARIAAVAVLLSVGALAVFPAPGGATLECPPGTAPPSPYCANVPPVAKTVVAFPVFATVATLNGSAGPGVLNGDPPHYYFQYGKTKAYGKYTTQGTVPSGPPLNAVSTKVSGLSPVTTYHFQLCSFSPDGIVCGADKAFKTGPRKPIAFVFPPGRVKHKHRFGITIKLKGGTTLVLDMLRNGRLVKHLFNGIAIAGRVHLRVGAPARVGKYVIRVKARGGGTNQTVRRTLTVT
jgi:hypothetical protein